MLRGKNRVDGRERAARESLLRGAFPLDVHPLVLILVAYVIANLFTIGSRYFFGDELISLEIAQAPLAKLLAMSKSDIHPPLHPILLKYWVELFGAGEIPSRLLSVAITGCALVVAYQIVHVIHEDRRWALACAALTAFHPLILLNGSAVRWYPLLNLWALLAIFFFLKVQRGGARNSVGGYAVAVVAGLYTDSSMVIVPACLTIYLLSNWRKLPRGTWRRWLLIHVVILLAFAPWIPTVLHHITFNLPRVQAIALTKSAFALGYMIYGLSIGQNIMPWRYVVTVPYGLVLFYLLLCGLRASWRPTLRNFLFPTVFLCSALAMILYLRLPQPRYFLYLVPIFSLLILMGIAHHANSGLRTGFVLVVVAVYAVSLWNLYHGRDFHKGEMNDPWGEIISYLGEEVGETGLVLTYNRVLAYYAARSPQLEGRVIYLVHTHPTAAVDLARAKGTEHIYYVQTAYGALMYFAAIHTSTLSLLKDHLHLSDVRSFSEDPFWQHKKRFFPSIHFPQYRVRVLHFQPG